MDLIVIAIWGKSIQIRIHIHTKMHPQNFGNMQNLRRKFPLHTSHGISWVMHEGCFNRKCFCVFFFCNKKVCQNVGNKKNWITYFPLYIGVMECLSQHNSGRFKELIWTPSRAAAKDMVFFPFPLGFPSQVYVYSCTHIYVRLNVFFWLGCLRKQNVGVWKNS